MEPWGIESCAAKPVLGYDFAHEPGFIKIGMVMIAWHSGFSVWILADFRKSFVASSE